MAYRYWRLTATVAAVVLAADAISKAVAVALTRRLGLLIMHNSAGAFGIHFSRTATVLSVAGAAVMAARCLWMARRSPAWAVASGLMAGGAAGNLTEKQLLGSVVDWIHPPHWPAVFNLADVAVVSGGLLAIALAVVAARAAEAPRTATASTPGAGRRRS
jgi:signal peptidase II